jgi:hypothetical protein
MYYKRTIMIKLIKFSWLKKYILYYKLEYELYKWYRQIDRRKY